MLPASPATITFSVASSFYFAEGYTGPGFEEWLTLQNPNAEEAVVEVTYMIKGGDNLVKHYTVGAETRYTVNVNDEVGSNKEVSTKVTCDKPIVAERPMYFDSNGRCGGHVETGLTR